MAVERSVHVGPIQLQPRVIVYATIIQLASFAFFDAGNDPWSEDGFLTLVAISLGPMLALAMAHIFSEILDHDVRGVLSKQNLQEILSSNLQFLYVGIIPIILAVPMTFAGLNANTSITTIFIVGAISLFVWGAIAARLAGRNLKDQVFFGIGYGLIGCLIVALELWLRH